MITRLWRGWTLPDNADAYESFLIEELFPSMRSIPGFRGANVLRRSDGDEVAFVTLTRFDSLEAIRSFAGEDYETPVLEPQALALLSRYEERAVHYATSAFRPDMLEFQVIWSPDEPAGEHHVTITLVERDEHAIRVRYEIEPPLSVHRFGLSGQATDDLGNEYDDVGGAFGLQEHPRRTDGVLSFPLPPADAMLLHVRLEWESFDEDWQGLAHELRVRLREQTDSRI